MPDADCAIVHGECHAYSCATLSLHGDSHPRYDRIPADVWRDNGAVLKPGCGNRRHKSDISRCRRAPSAWQMSATGVSGKIEPANRASYRPARLVLLARFTLFIPCANA